MLLLNDRGWGGARKANVWEIHTVEILVEEARMVVGPDEPPDGRSYDEESRQHFGMLADILNGKGVVTTGEELKNLPHDVIFGDRLRAVMNC